MKQILCVVDFLESPGRVLEVAARIANACTAHLIVLFPYRLINNGHLGDIPSLKKKLETEAREKFRDIRSNLPEMENLSIEFSSEIGFIPDRIEAHLKHRMVDLVVIGQQQPVATGDFRNFNVQKLITDSKLPFVIVPAEVNTEATYKSR